jgi:VanZ family protein
MTKQITSLSLALVLTLTLFLLGSTELAMGLARQPYDLLLHAGFFGFLALLLWHASAYKARLTFILVSTLTIADELYQSRIPGRHASEYDVLAGMLGALIVLVLLSLMTKLAEKENIKLKP